MGDFADDGYIYRSDGGWLYVLFCRRDDLTHAYYRVSTSGRSSDGSKMTATDYDSLPDAAREYFGIVMEEINEEETAAANNSGDAP